MKKIYLYISLLLLFVGCENEILNNKSLHNQYINNYTTEEIDLIVSEMATFHQTYMVGFLDSICPTIDSEDSLSSFNLIMISIQQTMLDYNFQEIDIPISNYVESNSNIISLPLINDVALFWQNNFDFAFLQNNSELIQHLDMSEIGFIADFFRIIDLNVLPMIEKSDSFEDFRNSFSSFIQSNLSDCLVFSSKEMYFYAKLYAEIYLSSIDYFTNFMYEQDKGPRWEKFKGTLKEAWEITRPIVTADAVGAVFGAMAGTITGPGIVVTGMTNACMSSAMECIN